MITFQGASDDLVEVQGCPGADEFSPADIGRFALWRGDLVGPGAAEQMRVHVIFDRCWHVAVGQVLEDVKLPAWQVRFRQGGGLTEAARRGEEFPESAYTVVLEVDAPPGTRLDNVWPEVSGE